MSILPMVLCGLVICGMYKIHAQNMYQTYEIDSQTFLIDFYSPMELMGKITEHIYDDIREIAEENPEKFYTYMWKRTVYAELFPAENRFLPEDMIQYSLGNDMGVGSVLYEMNEISSAGKFSTGG